MVATVLSSLDHRGDWRLKVFASFETSAHIIPIHVGDDFQRNFLRANACAFPDAGAVAEGFGIHLRHHAQSSALALGFSLGKNAEVCDLGSCEECS